MISSELPCVCVLVVLDSESASDSDSESKDVNCGFESPRELHHLQITVPKLLERMCLISKNAKDFFWNNTLLGLGLGGSDYVN
jgi:hypothetical protein